MRNRSWDDLGRQASPSWYLDPVVARQKRDAHLALIRGWWTVRGEESALKTDLFEEAFGADRILQELLPEARLVCGIDTAHSTARAAARRGLEGRTAACDVRRMPFRPGSFHVVISTSTLDHFETREEFVAALREIHRVMLPGGLLILTLDNPLNPIYPVLKFLSRSRLAPYPLGYTPAPRVLARMLEQAGFEVRKRDWLLHNPRLISTALFLACRKTLGTRADGPIQWLLRAFALLDKLPSRRWTACFQAVAASKSPAMAARNRN